MKVKAGDVVIDEHLGACLVLMAEKNVIFGPNVILEDRSGRTVHLPWRIARDLRLDPGLTAIEALKKAGRLGM